MAKQCNFLPDKRGCIFRTLLHFYFCYSVYTLSTLWQQQPSCNYILIAMRSNLFRSDLQIAVPEGSDISKVKTSYYVLDAQSFKSFVSSPLGEGWCSHSLGEGITLTSSYLFSFSWTLTPFKDRLHPMLPGFEVLLSHLPREVEI